MNRSVTLAGVAAAGVGTYLGLVTGAIAIDVGIGRRMRRLGPEVVHIDAPRERVFDLIFAPYAVRAPRAMREKVQVLERGEDLVLAAHRTPVRGHLTATTVETVRFTRPSRFDFRLVRGPVPHVVETFELTEAGAAATRLTYTGELGTDLWGLGQRWGNLAARKWEATVHSSLAHVKQEAERTTSTR